MYKLIAPLFNLYFAGGLKPKVAAGFFEVRKKSIGRGILAW